VLFVHNTSRVDDEPYPTLLQDKGFGGFPSLCFMDAEGNVLAKPAQRTVAAFTKMYEGVNEELTEQRKRRAELEAKAKAGDAVAAKQLFLADLGSLNADTIKAGMKQHKLSKDERAQVDERLTDLEVQAILAKTGVSADKIAEELAALAKAGRRPSKPQTFLFWPQVLQHAAKRRDAVLAQQAFTELESFAVENKSFQSRLPQLRILLQQAQAK
jgi:hypothetical protein